MPASRLAYLWAKRTMQETIRISPPLQLCACGTPQGKRIEIIKKYGLELQRYDIMIIHFFGNDSTYHEKRKEIAPRR